MRYLLWIDSSAACSSLQDKTSAKRQIKREANIRLNHNLSHRDPQIIRQIPPLSTTMADFKTITGPRYRRCRKVAGENGYTKTRRQQQEEMTAARRNNDCARGRQ
jgi:hypothetical protein